MTPESASRTNCTAMPHVDLSLERNRHSNRTAYTDSRREGREQKMSTVGFEPTPFRNAALTHRLRPLGQIDTERDIVPSHSLKEVATNDFITVYILLILVAYNF